MIATCLFEVNLLVLGLVFTRQWLYAAWNHRLVSPDYPESAIWRRVYHGMIIPVISLAGIMITLAGFDSSTMIYMTAPLATYVVDRYTTTDHEGTR